MKRSVSHARPLDNLTQSSSGSEPEKDIDVTDPQSLTDTQSSESQVLPVLRGKDQNTEVNTVDVEMAEETVVYSIGIVSKVCGWIMWILIVLANAYAIVTLALGED